MHNFSGPELGKSAGVLRSYSRPSFTEPVDFVLDDYPRSSMMWGSIRFTLRKQWRNFRRSHRVGRALLWRQLRSDGSARLLLDVLMHLPVVLVGISLFIIVTNHSFSVHLSGYSVGAAVFAFACTSLMTSVMTRFIGIRWLLGMYAVVNIPALVYLSHLSGGGGSIGTTEYALMCLAVGVTIPPWSVLSQRHRAHNTEFAGNGPVVMAWSNMLNLSMYPLAALLTLPAMYYGGGRAGLWVTAALDVLLIAAVLFTPSLLPGSRPRTAVTAAPTPSAASALLQHPETQLPHTGRGVHVNVLKLLLVLGTAMLGACLGSAATGLLGMVMSYDSLYLYPVMIAVGTGVIVVVAVPILLGGFRIVPWQGWLVSGVTLVFAAMLLPASSSIEGTTGALVLFGAALGASLAGQSLSLSMLMGHSPDSQVSFIARSMSAVGITMGSMWGGFLGDSPYYRNAFMVPIIAACLYLVLGHVFGYVWRLDYEEHLEPLPEAD